MKTKWQFLTERFSYNDELSEMAKWFADFLRLEYPGVTERWIHDKKHLEDMSNKDIVRQSGYCTACQEHDYADLGPDVCSICKFAEIFGECCDNDSWWSQLFFIICIKATV